MFPPRDLAERSLLVCCAQSELGGGELSLLEELERNGNEGRAFFLIPGPGGLSRYLEARRIPFRCLPWPGTLDGLSQRNGIAQWMRLPAALPGLVRHVWRVHGYARNSRRILSHGLRSHCLFLALLPWHGIRMTIDVRDFIRPLWLRRLLAAAARLWGAQVVVNSRAVGRDFPGAEVVYPVVRSTTAAAGHRSGRRIITHCAYFAPYKGQDLFLDLARLALDRGLDAEFWLIGDVIYPQRRYREYAEGLRKRARRLGLEGRVRFWGRVAGPPFSPGVPELLAQSDLLLHCSREPEPFGRVIIEALRCGCEVICHAGSGACELLDADDRFPPPFSVFREGLGKEYVRVRLPGKRLSG